MLSAITSASSPRMVIPSQVTETEILFQVLLVEQDVTHPFEYDFYLNAHSAIQGTARPVHYHVLQDDAKVPVNDFQKMIYQFSYQFMRSTTPVSLCKF